MNELNEFRERIAKKFGIPSDAVFRVLRATAFSQSKAQQVVTEEQMVALLNVALEYNLNPFVKQIYAYPDRSGIIPVVGADGWLKIINEHPEFNGMDINYSDKIIEIGKRKHQLPEWLSCTIYRKDRAVQTTIREYTKELFRDLDGNTPWNTHPNRMLRHKIISQAARVCFSFTGIYDPDEAQRILEARRGTGKVYRTPDIKIEEQDDDEEQLEIAPPHVILEGVLEVRRGAEPNSVLMMIGSMYHVTEEQREKIRNAFTVDLNDLKKEIEDDFNSRKNKLE